MLEACDEGRIWGNGSLRERGAREEGLLRGGRGAAVDCEVTGWGLWVGHRFAAGNWSVLERKVLEDMQ